MSRKYQQDLKVSKFYYSAGSNYFAVISDEMKKLDHIKRIVLHHYLGDDYSMNEVAREKGKICGKMIHTKENLAALVSRDDLNNTIPEDISEQVDIELSPIMLGSETRKNELRYLINNIR